VGYRSGLDAEAALLAECVQRGSDVFCMSSGFRTSRLLVGLIIAVPSAVAPREVERLSARLGSVVAAGTDQFDRSDVLRYGWAVPEPQEHQEPDDWKDGGLSNRVAAAAEREDQDR
jgi:hypothetical protein